MITKTKERRQPLDTPAAADYLNVMPSHLERLRCNGGGPVFIKHNGFVRYDPDNLDEWLEAGKRRSTSDNGDTQYALVANGKLVCADFGDGSHVITTFWPAVIEQGEWLPILDEGPAIPGVKPVYWLDGERVVRTFPIVPKSLELAR
jgi:Helix-turn-helix domain